MLYLREFMLNFIRYPLPSRAKKRHGLLHDYASHVIESNLFYLKRIILGIKQRFFKFRIPPPHCCLSQTTSIFYKQFQDPGLITRTSPKSIHKTGVLNVVLYEHSIKFVILMKSFALKQQSLVAVSMKICGIRFKWNV